MEPEKKRAIILTICAIVFILLGTRLAYLQLFSTDELRGMSDKNSIKTITITPPRGLMYDRNGKKKCKLYVVGKKQFLFILLKV